MTGIVNSTGARSGVIGTTVGTPSGGKVLQVLQTVKTDKESGTGSNAGQNVYDLVPGQGGSGVFQQAITITGSNKVLISACVNVSCATTSWTVLWAIHRGAAVDTAVGSCTRVAVGTDAASSQSSATGRGATNNAYHNINSPMIWLDSPGAGTHYYKIAVDCEGTVSWYVNRSSNDTNAGWNASVPSSITLMEIAV